MSWNTIKLDKADILFSRYIRRRDGKCVRCGRKGEGDEGIKGLQASHFFSRRNESVRFDLENVDSLCPGCHRYLGTEHRDEYEKLKKKQLGEVRLDMLRIRANTYQKKDRKLQAIIWKEMLKKPI